jgi:class 3 adenylate cyclase
MPGGKAADQQGRRRGPTSPGTLPAASTAAMDAAVAYVPRVLLETLAAHTTRPTPWYEWVDGTLVMADVSGFTAMSERLAQAGKEGAEWLTDIINWYFGQMLDIASGCGGTTLTFGGDAILLLFYGEDHERRGIAASLRMLNATRLLPAYHVANHRIRLSMSMGAHSGRILTASVGARGRAQYLVLGPETVETAKAEAQASSGELAITAAMSERVAESAVLEPLGDFFRVESLVNTPRFGPAPAKSSDSVPADVLSAYVPEFVSGMMRGDPGAGMSEQDHEHRDVTIAFVNVLGVDSILAHEGADAQRHLHGRLQDHHRVRRTGGARARRRERAPLRVRAPRGARRGPLPSHAPRRSQLRVRVRWRRGTDLPASVHGHGRRREPGGASDERR